MTLSTLARTEASDSKNLCFVQCGTASTLRGTSQAPDTHVLEELIFSQGELRALHVLGRRARASEFWAPLLCIKEVQRKKQNKNKTKQPLNEGRNSISVLLFS